MLKLDFNNTLKWSLKVNDSKKARLVNGQLLIEPFNLKKTFKTPIIAIGIEVPGSRDTWKAGGELLLEFPFRYSWINYNNYRKAYYKVGDLLIDRIAILQLPEITTREYSLVYQPPNHYREFNIQVWEYLGSYEDVSLQKIANWMERTTLNCNVQNVDSDSDLISKLDSLITNQQLILNELGIKPEVTAEISSEKYIQLSILGIM